MEPDKNITKHNKTNRWGNIFMVARPTIKEDRAMSGLSAEQTHFMIMLEKAPYLKHLWDFNERGFIPEKVEGFLSSASHGEAIMARFFLGVWQGENNFNFDIFEAAKTLDRTNLNIIVDWLNRPLTP